MRHFLICLLAMGLLWAIASCKKNNSSPDPNVPLVNNWQWLRRTNALALNGALYDTLTPANTGITEFLYMNADSTWAEIQNGKEVDGGRFRFLTLLTPTRQPITSLDLIGKSGKDSTVNHWISHDTLYTSNIPFAGTYSVDVYVRWVCISCSGQ